MKNIKYLAFTLLFSFITNFCFSQSPIKGTGVCYFSNNVFVTAFVPNVVEDCEWGYDVGTGDMYRWDRVSSVWVLAIPSGGVPFISTDLPNAIVNTTSDNGWLVDMTTMASSAPITIGGNTYPAGTSLETLLNQIAGTDTYNTDESNTSGAPRVHQVGANDYTVIVPPGVTVKWVNTTGSSILELEGGTY